MATTAISYRTVLLLVAANIGCATPALADQGGLSFWLPGQFGSLAAAPGQPGFNFTSIYFHTSVSSGGAVAAAREVAIGGQRGNLNVNLDLNLDARGDLVFLLPGYTFEKPVFGGQLWVGMATITGRSTATIDGMLSTTLGPFALVQRDTLTNSSSGFGDLFPQATLKWNNGVHNFMFYGMTNIRVGSYDSTRLTNIGLGFNAWDGGAGYTYFDPVKGLEFSATAGLTYNNTNRHTNYRNGLDFHVDFGAAKFLSKQFFVGAVGYIYQQIEADRGSAPFLGDVKSRVYGIGPQIGYMFPVSKDVQGYFNLKGYYEFEAEQRPEGWNAWLTVSFSPAPRSASDIQKRMR